MTCHCQTCQVIACVELHFLPIMLYLVKEEDLWLEGTTVFEITDHAAQQGVL